MQYSVCNNCVCHEGTAPKIMKIHGISEIAIQDIVQKERAGLLNTILIIEFKKIVLTLSIGALIFGYHSY